jgi:hypothetical protein
MNRNNMFFNVFATMAIGVFILMAGCKSGTQEQTTDNDSQIQEIDKESIEKEVENLVMHLPTPFEFAEMLNNIGARYVDEVLNSPDHIDRYFTERQQALNLGVYGADLGYSSVYERTQQTKEYLDAVRTMLNELKVDVDYSFFVDEDKRAKLNNQDTLVNVLTNTFYEAYKFLNEKNSSELTALMAAGTWIEGLYIATHISEDTYNNIDMVKLIYDQAQSLEQLLQLMEKFKNNPDVSDLYNRLQELKSAYKSTDGSLTREELSAIKDKIGAIRNDVVS